jgi:hypothetical protein
MNRKPVLLLVIASVSVQGCFFFVIPGSVTGKISDAITGAKGANCVRESTKVGDQIRGPDGNIGTVKSLSGTSQRCTDERYPIRAELEFVPDTVTQGAPPSVHISPIHFDLSAGWQVQPLADMDLKGGWYAKVRNRHIDAVAVLSARTHDGITDIADYTQTRKAALLRAITDPVPVEEVHPIEINGRPAFRYVVKGKDKSGKPATFVATIIEGPDDVAIVIVYTYATNFDERKEAMKQLSEQVVGFRQ